MTRNLHYLYMDKKYLKKHGSKTPQNYPYFTFYLKMKNARTANLRVVTLILIFSNPLVVELNMA